MIQAGQPFTTLYTIAEVAAIVDITDHTAKNWTLGRPIEITHSIKISSGRKPVQLYPYCDVFLFALATRLIDVGITHRTANIIIANINHQMKSLANTEGTTTTDLSDIIINNIHVKHTWLNKQKWAAIKVDAKKPLKVEMHLDLDSVLTILSVDSLIIIGLDRIRYWVDDRIARLDAILTERKLAAAHAKTLKMSKYTTATAT